MKQVQQNREKRSRDRNPYHKFKYQCVECGVHYRSDKPLSSESCVFCGSELEREVVNATIKDEKVKITEGRVNLILDNLELPAEELSELTDGLAIPEIKLIQRLEREGKRGIQSVN